MLTKDEIRSATEFHWGECQLIVGPRGGRKYRMEIWRRNGGTRYWKTRPDHFRIPVKHGFWEYWHIDESNQHEFHTSINCPLNKDLADEG